MSKRKNGIYVTHGKKPMLVGYKAVVNGVLSLVYMKGDKVVCYEPWENLCQQFRNGPCLEIKETMMGPEDLRVS